MQIDKGLVADSTLSISVILAANAIRKRRTLAITNSCEIATTEFEKWRRKAATNDWLKHHGQPMKRRGV